MRESTANDDEPCSSPTGGDGKESMMGDRERAQKGSEISDVGETCEVLPVEDERRVTSSKVFRMTVLGSSLASFSVLIALTGLFVTEYTVSVTVELGFSGSSAYSGSELKLSGTMITWYVPGVEISAFLSRSSSEVNNEKAGSASPREK
jgi:hypothetical protein